MSYNFDELYGAGTVTPAKQTKATSPSGFDFDQLAPANVKSPAALESSMFIASLDDPERLGKTTQLTKAWKELTGEELSPRIVEPNELARKLRRRTNEETLKTSPTLSRLFEDPKFAGLAFDDVEQLSTIERTVKGTLGDIGVVAAKGAVGLPQAAVGLASILTGGYAGKGAEAAGVRFKDAQKALDTMFSPAQQAANKNVRQADGFLETIQAALTNPSVIATTVGESLPQMLGGVGVARGLLAAFPKLAPLIAGAAGEGVVAAGSAAEQIRADTPDELLTIKQSLSALGSGAGTALFGVAGGKLAQKLKLDDIDTVLARGGLDKASAETVKNGFVRRIVGGGISEGLFEELPQSAQEQMWQNFATDKPIMEGVGNAAALGLLSGFVMGGGFNAVSNLKAEQDMKVNAAGENLKVFTELLAATEAAQLRARDVDAFQGYLKALGDESGSNELFLDPNALQQSGIDLSLLQQVLPSVAEQLAQPDAGMRDIVIPRDEFFARLPGSGLEQSLLPLVRAELDGLSAKEAETELKNAATFFQAETEKAIQQEQVDTETQQSQQVVEQDMLRQLTEANRFTGDVNNAYAKLMASFFGTLAARMNKAGQQTTAEEQYRQFALRVNAQSVAGDQQLDQPQEEFNAVVIAQEDDPNPFPEGMKYAVSAGSYGTLEYFKTREEAQAWADQENVFQAEQAKNKLEQSASLRRGTETLKRFGLDPTKKHNVRQVASALEARQRAKYGSVARDDRSAPTARKLAKWMVEEVLFEAQNPGASGVGWYSTKFQQALDILAGEFPELATDQNARDTMTALIAVTSDGQKVNENFLMAVEVYGNFRTTGEFKSDRGHARDSSIKGNLAKIQELYGKLGAEGMRELLMREITVGEINKAARAAGEKVSSDYTADTKMPVAATVFGPKLGAFYANLMGSSGYLTMDRWWSRTFNRYRGTLVAAPTRQGLDRFKELIGRPELSDDQAIAETVQYRKSYEARNFKEGTEIEKAANTIYKAAFEALEDAPFNATDRGFMIQTVKFAQQNLQRRGIEMSIADIQAVLWYYEKRLYGDLGARQSADVSYEEAARRAVAARTSGDTAGGTLSDATDRRDPEPAEGPAPGEEPYTGGTGSGNDGQNRLHQGWAGREPGLVAASALARQAARGVSKLVGLPDLPIGVGGEWYIAGPVGVAHDAARDYVEGTGQPYTPVRNYVPVDEARAKRIAAAFDEMKHSPNDPEVKAAYRAMIDETLAQYQVIKATGLKVEFITGADPYAESPRQAIVDVVQNNHLWVFPTDNGFGSSGADVSGNPLLELTDEYIDGKRLRANDVFRIVHDYFGHIKDGNGFRAEGEENAWRSHAAMYSPLARRAMTTETRGQNSWVNFGPQGEKNRKATAAETVYADQKIGLLPEWVSEEGRTDAVPPQSLPAYGTRTPGSVSVVGVHFSRQPLSHVSTATYGTNAAGAERSRVMNANDKRLRARSFFYVNEGQGVKAERGVGSVAHVVRLENLYDVDADPLRIWDGKFLNNSESAILDAGFDGYYARNSFTDMGTVTLLGNHVVPVVKAGFETDANALIKNDVAPAAKYSVQRQVASLILNSKDIPAGRMAPAEWKAKIDAAMPEVSKKLPSELFAGNDPIYRDDLMRALFQGEQARGQITFGNDITQTPSVITLLKNADLSTFLHEAGHFYLEVMTNVANQPNAPQEIIDDVNRLMKWFNVPGGLGEWNSMTLDQKRASHEKFARGFEAYLFEGKAPSVELKGAFSRFRAWLVNVYRNLAGLNVQLDDTVRGVFDRLLATEEQIKEAEALRGFTPIFKSAEEMGATPEEWAAYQNLHSDATQTATEQLQARSLRDMQWTANARGRSLRKLQRDAESKRKAVEAEVTAEVQQEKVYAVQKWLKTGVLPDGTQTVGAKLDLAALKEMYGEDPAAPWRYLSNGVNGLAGNEGLHPDQVAEMFGYSSGDSMVKAILAADPESTVIEGMTDQRMLERYGDLSSPAGLEKAANEAVHNEARGRFIATELAALNNAVNVREDTGRTVTDSRGRTRKITTNVMVKAAKDFATNLINRSKIKDIKPSQYATAEGRAAKNAERTKNFTEKVTEKRNQLVNHYAARAANDAVDYVEKQVAYLKKVADSETIDQEYRDQIQQLLEKVELRRVTEGTLRKRASLLEWIEDQEAKGLDPVIDRALVESAQQINYRTMTLEEFRGLVDTVKNIEHLGRLKHKLLTAKDDRDLAQAVEELRASVEANHNREAKVRIETGRGLEKIGRMARGFVAMHRKFASIAREMDGGKDGGPMWERLVRPMNEAGDNEVTMRAQATDKLAEIFKLLDGIKLTRKEEVLPGVSMTREARIMMALNWGNEGNRQRVIDGGLDGRRRLSQQEAEQIVFGLTSKEWDFVESMWAFVESYRPMIAEQEKRLTGVEPKWVEPTPFRTPQGRDIKGGYFPAKYDGDLSTRSNELEAVTDLRQQMMGAAGRSATRNGYTKERSEAVKDRPLRKDFGVIMQHVSEVTHRLAWQDWLIDARRLLNAKPLDSAIREFYGPEILKEMKSQLMDIAQGDIGAQSDLDRILGHIRSGVTIAGMGWNLMTGMMQPLGLSQSIVRVGAADMARGLAHFAANPIDATKQAQAKSKFMASRSLQLNRDLSDILNKIDKEKISNVEASYFWFIYKFQTAIDVPTWWGAYEKAIAENNDEARSIALADQAVIDAQGGGTLKDQARIQRGGAGQKLFTAFYSFFNTTYNLAVEQGRTAGVKGGMAVPKLASDYLMLLVIPAMAGAILKALVKGELDDDDLLKKLLAEQLNYLFGTMVLLREVGGGISAAVNGFSYTGPASLRVFGEVAKLAKQAEQGEIDAALLRSLNSIAGIVLHYPAGQVQRTVEGFNALYEGETSNPAALLFGAPKN